MIRSLHIKNFKAFENQLFELRPLTLLSGLNNTGKSCVLQSLLLLRQSYQQGLLPKTGLALNGDLVRIGRGQDALSDWAEDDSIGFDIVLGDGTEAKWIFDYSSEAEHLLLASAPDDEVYKSSLFNRNFHYLLPGRRLDYANLALQLKLCVPGTIILAEHPESHLHPTYQTKLGKLFALAANSGVQVILETHSDHIFNAIRVAVHGGELDPKDVQLYYFQRQEEPGQSCIEVLSPQIDRNGRIDEWPDGFFDELDKSLMVLLEPATSH